MEIERSDFVGAVSRLGDSVYSFHERFGLPTVAHESEEVILEVLRRRLALLSEEVGEHSGNYDNNLGHRYLTDGRQK